MIHGGFDLVSTFQEYRYAKQRWMNWTRRLEVTLERITFHKICAIEITQSMIRNYGAS